MNKLNHNDFYNFVFDGVQTGVICLEVGMAMLVAVDIAFHSQTEGDRLFYGSGIMNHIESMHNPVSTAK